MCDSGNDAKIEAENPAVEKSFPWPAEKIRQYTLDNTRLVEVKGHYFTRFVLWLLLGIVRSFSQKTSWRIGTFAGSLMHLLGIRRKEVMINLDIVYGDKRTPAQKDAIYKGCMINLTRMAMNYLRIPLYDESFWKNNIKIENEQSLTDAYNKGKGVIILSMHYGAWEIAGGKFGMSGYPISNIIKIMKNPATERLLNDLRNAMNLGAIAHKGSVERIKEGLRRGEGIIMAIDQNMGKRYGVFVDWFGRPASTIRSCAYLAKETGATVVAGYSRQKSYDDIEIVVIGQIPWESHPEDPEKELYVNTRNYIAVFEKPIYREPEGWLWLHRRWKRQPEGMSNPYAK